MKKIVSVSIGSSERNKKVGANILGEQFIIERIGTDGDIKKAIELIRQLDGEVDAFGMGGIDLYLSGARKTFMIREAVKIKEAAKIAPIVDGTWIKNTLEGEVITYLDQNKIIDFKGKKALVTCAADRYKMAERLVECGCEIVLGDLIFALDIPIPMRSLKVFRRVIDAILPIVALLPFKFLYPTGNKQKNINANKKYAKFYEEADIIAGDFHYIKKNMPEKLNQKIVITNTVTEKDVELLRERGVKLLVTTTPEFNGRSFGTNVIEAIFVCLSGKKPEMLDRDDYYKLIQQVDFKPRIVYFNGFDKAAEL